MLAHAFVTYAYSHVYIIILLFLNYFLCSVGKNYEKVCEICHITLNKSAIFGDNGTVSPGGVRIGMHDLLNHLVIYTFRELLNYIFADAGDLFIFIHLFRYTSYDIQRMS